MTAKSITADEQLTQLCHDLRQLWEQAGGPSVRKLADKVGLGKTQVGAILSGGIRRPPDWHVVRGLVEAFYKHAHDHGLKQHLAISAGLDEYWRPRHAVVEFAFSHSVRGQRDRSTDAVRTLVPQQLPPIAPHFAGRQAELSTLTAVAGGPIAIIGMAGVGKTTLAVAWAHQVAGQFPDGQLYLDLRGFDPSGQAMTPANAVRAFLETLLPAPHRLPSGFEAQVGLYRSLLADKRMLVVLDNARDADQIRALLPGSVGCRVLVTSRVEQTSLVATDGAFPLRLGVLPDHEARQLLANRLGQQRISAEPEAADRLIGVCSGLPIALAIVAARAASRPDFGLSTLADETDRARGGLNALRLGDPAADARAVFSWSYTALPPDAARMFRLIGIHPGPDVSAAAAASLAGIGGAAANALLEQLCRANMLMEHAPGRYALHDLLREYARELAHRQETTAARRRMFDHYLHTALVAAQVLNPSWEPVSPPRLGRGVIPEGFSSTDVAHQWWRRELPVLLAAFAPTHAAGFDVHIWQIAWALTDFVERQGAWDAWEAAHEAGLRSARRLADSLAQAHLHRGLGRLRMWQRRSTEATAHLQQAEHRFVELGDLHGQARTQHNLTQLADAEGRWHEGLAHALRSLELSRLVGDPASVAKELNAVGWCHGKLGDLISARLACEEAVAVLGDLGDVNQQAAALHSLAYVHHQLGEDQQAIGYYERATQLAISTGDRFCQARNLDSLGDSRAAVGDLDNARRDWAEAARILHELGQPAAAQVQAKLHAARNSA